MTIATSEPASPNVERATVDRREFAELLGVSTETLDRHRADLPAPLKTPFRRVLWSRDDVKAYLAGKKRPE